jgi:hypothetical protein
MSITRDSDDSGLRWYEDDSGNRFMSVTTVLGFLETDDSGLQYWKARNQGDGDDKHWEHIYWYSAPRGTLAHYHCLNPLADREMWGEEETDALQQITNGPQKPEPCDDHDTVTDDCDDCVDGTFDDASHDTEDIVYSILHNQDVITSRDTYEEILSHCTLAGVALRDCSWVTDTFENVARELGIVGNEVAVEQYLLDESGSFGGQCDLLYVDPGGNVVMSDLKTSSSLREKHILQSVAYGVAVERADGLPDTVDRHEIIRIDPDSKEYEVHSHERPRHMNGVEWYDTDNWFADSYGDYEYDSIDGMYDEFVACVERAMDAVDDGDD